MPTKPLTYAGLAVVVAAAVAAPFVVHAHHGDSGSPGSPASPTSPAAAAHDHPGALTGDLDGDGRPDQVSLRGGHLRVWTAADAARPVVRLMAEGRLVGLADVGGPAAAAVVSTSGEDDGTGGRTWQVWRLAGRAWHQVGTRHHEVLGTEPGFETAWLTGDGRLMTGLLDPVQREDDQVSVQARRWTLDSGQVAARPVATWCWDRKVEETPRPCRDGEDFRADMGPHGDLPRLLPARHLHSIRVGDAATIGGQDFELRRAAPAGPVEARRAVLATQTTAGEVTAHVPVGWSPVLFTTPVDLGSPAISVLTSQEGGDSDTWRVWWPFNGSLTALHTRGPVALGGGFTGAGAYLSWMGPDRHLYTRVPQHGTAYTVYEWELGDGAPSGPPVLQARSLGTVCLDETDQTYGRC